MRPVDKPSAYRGDAPYVFVCYAHDDAEAVHEDIVWLAEHGVNVWYDEGIPAGTNWRAQIGDALEGAQQVIFYASGASVVSDHCDREVNFALDEAKPIVPVRLDDTVWPADLKMALSRVQLIDRTAMSAANYRDALLHALEPTLGESNALGSVARDSQAGGPQTTPPPPLAERRRRYRSAVAAMAVATVLAVGAAFWLDRRAQDPGNVQAVDTSDARERSIAVLPFVNMSADPDQVFFSEGISEEVLNLLARNRELSVISRSSSFSFKGTNQDIPSIARQLDVAHVLEGSVRTANNRVRVTAQLIEAATDTHLWSETYDRELDDIFAIQDEIAAHVVEKLNAALMGELEPSDRVHLDAYAAYLRGRFLRSRGTREELLAAEQSLKRALEVEPDYPEAWTQLALTYNYMRNAGALPAAKAKRAAVGAAETAIAINPEYGEAYAILAHIALNEDRDWDRALSHAKRALELDPANGWVNQIAMQISLNLGDPDKALAYAQERAVRDPLCAECMVGLGTVYVFQRRYDEALEVFERSDALGGGTGDSNLAVAHALLLNGDLDASLARWQRANPGPFRVYGEAITYYKMGREQDFQAKFSELKEDFGDDYPTMVARVYAWLGNKDAAFEWLDRFTVEQPEVGSAINSYWEMLSPELEVLFDDPRWLPHLERMGLAPHQLARFEFNAPLPGTGSSQAR